MMFRSSKKEDSLKGFSISQEGFEKLDPPRSSMITQPELDYYVAQYKKRGFEGGLNYYKTRQVNWEQEAGLPRTIQHRTLMLTAGKDTILTPKMATGMKKTVPNLTMAVSLLPSSFFIFCISDFSFDLAHRGSCPLDSD